MPLSLFTKTITINFHLMKHWLYLTLIFLSFSIAEATVKVGEPYNDIDNSGEAADITSMAGYLEIPDFTVAAGDTCVQVLNLILESEEEPKYAGMQFDVCVPEGLELTEITVGESLKDYDVMSREIAPGRVRIVVYANGQQATTATDSLLYLSFVASGDSFPGEREGKVCRVYLSDAIGQDIILEDSEFTVAVTEPDNGVEGILDDYYGSEDGNAWPTTGIYTIDGRRLDPDSDSLLPGLYIVNGKKVLKK